MWGVKIQEKEEPFKGGVGKWVWDLRQTRNARVKTSEEWGVAGERQTRTGGKNGKLVIKLLFKIMLWCYNADGRMQIIFHNK